MCKWLYLPNGCFTRGQVSAPVTSDTCIVLGAVHVVTSKVIVANASLRKSNCTGQNVKLPVVLVDWFRFLYSFFPKYWKCERPFYGIIYEYRSILSFTNCRSDLSPVKCEALTLFSNFSAEIQMRNLWLFTGCQSVPQLLCGRIYCFVTVRTAPELLID